LNQHLTELVERIPALSVCVPQIEEALSLLEKTYRAGNKTLVCGNGGSAADAEHFSGELLKGFYKTRPLSKEEKTRVGADYATRLQGALPTIPLGGFSALNTAFSNDNEPELIFAQLVWGLGKNGDALVAFSTSGNSANVLHAVRIAKAKGMATIGFSGKTGGTLKSLADVTICVPATVTHLIQEYHLPIYHCMALVLEEIFFA